MSRNKRANGVDEIYENHLGRGFKNNTTDNRIALMERMYIRILTELASNRFKWKGLPKSVDVRFMELTLFKTGLSVFYFDKRYNKYFALRGGGTNWNNMLDNPVGFSVVGSNFVGMNISALKETENASKAIPIWSNYLRMPDLDIVYIYANKLAQLDRTIEINSLNARQTKVLVATENQKLSVTNFNRQVDEGQNAIFVKGALQDMSIIQALDLGIDPDSLEKLHILRKGLWNECMGLLGIDNGNQDKKERLVASEVEANDDQTSMMRYVNLNARRKAIEEINEYFNTNGYSLDEISVEYYTDEERQARSGIDTNSPPEIGS